ncbi:MAG: spermidine/putrescine ABC transporter substrate-binding protein, partial [Blautia sp.]
MIREKKMAKIAGNLSFLLSGIALLSLASVTNVQAEESPDQVVLRVANWEEYIDEGGWGPGEEIVLEDREGSVITGVNSMVEDFQRWYWDTYGIQVRVEYSTYGNNEDLYNQLTLGNELDLVCPSEYMFMKLIAEDSLQPLSADFFDAEREENYYIRGVSGYVQSVFDGNMIQGEPWSRYAAGYMWGTTGIV